MQRLDLALDAPRMPGEQVSLLTGRRPSDNAIGLIRAHVLDADPHRTQARERLQGVEQSPILRQGAQHYAAALERSGEGLVRTAVQQLERQASDLERIGSVLASHNRQAFHRKDQDFRMWMAGIVGVFAGIFLILLLPRFLPFSADSRVASLVMGNDRINAAYAMINSVDPVGVKKLQWGGQFYEAGGGEVSACLEKARQTGKDQKCTITVPVPAQ